MHTKESFDRGAAPLEGAAFNEGSRGDRADRELRLHCEQLLRSCFGFLDAAEAREDCGTHPVRWAETRVGLYRFARCSDSFLEAAVDEVRRYADPPSLVRRASNNQEEMLNARVGSAIQPEGQSLMQL